MGNREYWKNREEKARQNRIRDEEAYNRELRKIYAYMTDIASKEVAGFYSKYAKAEGITLAEAKQRLSAADIAEYARKAERYVPEKDFSDKANEEMRLYNAMMSINRLEMLKSSIGLGMVEGFDKMDKSMREGLTQAAIKEFERQAGILGQTVIAPLEAAQAIVDSSFHNATFSERIWLHQDMLRSELEKVLTEGLIMGVNSRVLARHISKVFGASQKDAERLMRTEISRVCTEAQKLSYERNGYEQYEIVCEPTACDQCMPLNGELFFTKDMRAGDNAPPFHPNCHCTTCAYEDLEAFEKWLDYKDNGGEDSWEEWKQRIDNDEDKKSDYKTVIPSKPLSQDAIRILNESDPVKQMKIINDMLDRYNLPKTNWSGRVMINKKQKQLGRYYRATGDIVLRPDSPIKTRIHEALHARTSYNKDGFIESFINKSINEAVVEYLAEWICRDNGIQYKETYTNSTRALGSIIDTLRVDDYKFAKTLFEIPFVDRYDWLSNMVDIAIDSNEYTAYEKIVLTENMDNLYGKIKK